MPERLKQILQRVVDYWNKFDKKQKRVIVSVAAVLLVAFGLLGWALSRPTYQTLITCTSAADAADVKALLDESKKNYLMTDDGLVFQVEKEDHAELTLLLADNNVPSGGYQYKDIFSEDTGLLPDDESTFNLKYKVALQQAIASMLEQNEYVRNAQVEVSIPERQYAVINNDQETTAAVTLTLKDELPAGAGETLAVNIAYMLGNETTDHIQIIDNYTNVIFSGMASSTNNVLFGATTQLTVKEQVEKSLSNKLTSLVLSMGQWSVVQVAANLDADFDERNQITTIYSVTDGREEGYLSRRYVSTSTNTSGSGGVPGTESNDEDTDYQYEDTTGNSSTSLTEEEFLVDSTITETKGATGVVHMENSSLTMSLLRYRVYNEDTLRAQGELDEITFEEFMAANSETLAEEADERLLSAISNATGIPESRISIIANVQPIFQPSSDAGFDLMTYLPLIVTLLIVVLLAFVVYRSTRAEEVVETEPELSVEELLNSTSQEALNDIDLQDKSETRKAIEKFVDENPDAVALLLRNWLDEEWE